MSRFMVVIGVAGTILYGTLIGRLVFPLGLSPEATAALMSLVPLFVLFHMVAFGLRFFGRGNDLLSWLSYAVMGWAALGFAIVLVRDVVYLAAYGLDGLGLSALWAWLSPRYAESSLVAFTAMTAGALFGFGEARRVPRVRDVEVTLPNLAPAFDGYTIAQLTDVHIGPTIKGPWLADVVAATNAVGADAIVITGDLVDGDVEILRDDIAPLAGLDAPDGVLYVTGNHEYYSGAPQWVAHVQTLGVQPLVNDHVAVEHDGAHLIIAGICDHSAGQFIRGHAPDCARAFDGAPDGARVLLAHQPRSVSHARGHRVDLQLSGHTHGGQFWPWNYFVPLQQPMVAGLARVIDDDHEVQVYTSRGTGYWGPPLRLLAPSEISRITLRAA